MPAFHGQTNQFLRIPLPSAILQARWLAEAAALGGKAWAEVRTRFVADGSDIEFKAADGFGNPLGTFKTKVVAQTARVQIPLDKDNTTGRMFFEASLPAHGLRQAGGPLTVCPPLRLQPRILEKDGGAAQALSAGKTYRLEAEAGGAPEGMPGELVLWVLNLRGRRPRFAKTLKVKGGKLTVLWQCAFPEEAANPVQADLDPGAETYRDVSFMLEAHCLGYAAATEALPFETLIDFNFGPAGDEVESREVDFVMPDGSEMTKPVPRDGCVSLAKPKTGEVRVKDVRTVFLEREVEATEKNAATSSSKKTATAVAESDTEWTLQIRGLPYGKTAEAAVSLRDQGGRELGRGDLKAGKRSGRWLELKIPRPAGSQWKTLVILDADSQEVGVVAR